MSNLRKFFLVKPACRQAGFYEFLRSKKSKNDFFSSKNLAAPRTVSVDNFAKISFFGTLKNGIIMM
jgi:hypothetical protein